MTTNNNMPTILVTGGAGYIGSHAIRKLVKAGYTAVIVDNFSTGLERNVHSEAILYKGDFSDQNLLTEIFSKHPIAAVMHFAASIEVGESVEKPIPYLENNTVKTAKLLAEMHAHGITKMIFSSTAAVYGVQEKVPISEDAPTHPLDPYGSSKLLTEQLIKYHAKFAGLNAVIFRFFNACGSDFDRGLRDTHISHLIPFAVKVIRGQYPELKIFGSDYQTIDGTGVRDYVHVVDIARAHIAGLEYLNNASGVEVFNIGTGNGQSVLQVVKALEQATGKPLPYKFEPRRPGDSPVTIADNAKIKKVLKFDLTHSDLETIVKTSI